MRLFPIPKGDMIYRIKKGRHYSSNRFIAIDNKVKISFYVDDSWYYTEKTPGWNKLVGLTHCISPKKNSARLAWRCIDKEIHIAAMFHCKGSDPVFIPLCKVKNNKRYVGGVTFEGNTYKVWIQDKEASKSCYKEKKNLFLCHPYFGGKDRAPHNIFILVRYA